MRVAIVFLLMMAVDCLRAQQPAVVDRHEQALEELAEKEEMEIDDDELVLQLESFRRNPVNLNTAGLEELQALQLLNAMQAKALIQHRELLGKLIHLYELQAIPHWDLETIRRILPYVTIADGARAVAQFAGVLRKIAKGSSMLMVNLAQALGAGSNSEHAGPPQKLMLRYRYNYKDLLQFGVLGEKDAGESLRRGFDFNSFHVFARKAGIVHSLALGDFTVNMGQGLIHWQSLSLRKSSQVMAGKRQSAILRPYTSAGEYNFHRGAAVTLRRQALSVTAFASFRKLDANLGLDTLSETVITSFLTAGLHRTAAELAERNNIKRQTFGGVLSYDAPSGHLGANIIQHHFSYPVQRKAEPYNLFAFRGRQLTNYSIDYDRTWRNVHLFGELAATHYGKAAVVQGMLVSLDRRVDASLVFRHLPPGFQSLQASAFTESSQPANESGLFMGLGVRPGRGYTINIYADVFRFPWLRFRTDAPSGGSEYFLQLAYQPHKKLELTSSLRWERKDANERDDTEAVNRVVPVSKTNWRTHLTWQVLPHLRLRQRLELVWVGVKAGHRQQGYLIYNDVAFQPPGRRFGFGGRVQWFETGGFESRVYAFENDAGVGYAVFAAYHKGLRYYFNLDFDLLAPRAASRAGDGLYIKLHLRWSQTINQMKAGRASPGENMPASEVVKMQVIFSKI